MGGQGSLDHRPVWSVHPGPRAGAQPTSIRQRKALRWAGAPLGAAAGGYTAFLFMQAKGRDLWQDHVLSFHFMVQTALAGSAAFVIIARVFGESAPALDAAHWMLVALLAAHVAFLADHLFTGRLSVDGRTAARILTHGRFRAYFWCALVAGTAAPFAMGPRSPQ